MESDVKYGVNAGFFDAINNDRVYSAEDMNMPYKNLISNGVFATPAGEPSDKLQVFSANDGMNVIVSSGNAIIGDKWFENPSNLIITISQNSALLTRIDSIIAQIDKTQPGRAGNIIYREGSASSNPVHPDINTEENIFELRLADISVSPSCVKITQDLITDCRGSNECPWVTSLIQQVDTSTLYAQWQAAYQKFYDDQEIETDEFFENFKQTLEDFFSQEEDTFTEWFEEMKNQLSEDAAGSLQLQINNMQTRIKDPCNLNSQKQIGFYYNTSPIDDLNSPDFLVPGEYGLQIDKDTNNTPIDMTAVANTFIFLKTISSYYDKDSTYSPTIIQELTILTTQTKFTRFIKYSSSDNIVFGKWNSTLSSSIGTIIIKKGTTITNGYEITLPLEYYYGNHSLEIYWNGTRLIEKVNDGHYIEIENTEDLSKCNKIQIYRTEDDGDYTLEEDIVLTQIVRTIK